MLARLLIQRSFSELEYAAKCKVTRRDCFLSQIEAVAPWSALVSALDSRYPKSDKRGRPQIGLERTQRVYIVHSALAYRTKEMKMLSTIAKPFGALLGLT